MPISFCPSCDASNPPDARFCAECGATLAPAPSPPPPARARGRASSRAGARRRTPRHQIQAGARAIARVKLFFFVLGCLSALVFGLVLLGLSRMRADEISQGAAVFVLALIGVPMVVCFVGVWRAQRHPLPWALGLAGLLTLNVATTTVMRGFPGVLPIVLMVSAWGLVAPVMKLHRLMREHPDDPAIAAVREGRSDRRGRRHGSLAREFATAGTILVGFLALLFGGVYGIGLVKAATAETREDILADQPDEPLGPTLARFENAWRNADYATMGELYHPRLPSSRARRLPRRFEQRDLAAPLPALSHRNVVNYGRMQQQATYRSSIGIIELVFEYYDGAWFMVALRLP